MVYDQEEKHLLIRQAYTKYSFVTTVPYCN